MNLKQNLKKETDKIATITPENKILTAEILISQ